MRKKNAVGVEEDLALQLQPESLEKYMKPRSFTCHHLKCPDLKKKKLKNNNNNKTAVYPSVQTVNV